jgi:hypothetical protein
MMALVVQWRAPRVREVRDRWIAGKRGVDC